MALNLSPHRRTRPVGSAGGSRRGPSGRSGAGDREGDDRQRETGPDQEQDIDRPAADGEEAHPAHRQQQPQQRAPDEGQPDDDQPLAPVLERHHEQPDADRQDHRQQRQLTQQAGEERPTDVERRPGHRRHQGESTSTAAACSAADTTLASSIARVIGPTPPGLGATWPATSTTSRATSPAILPSTRLTPTSRTAAPCLTMSLVISPGTPAAATTMSAFRTCAARSRVPVWQRVTVAFSDRRVSSSPSGRPTVTPRPTTHTSAPAICTSCRRSSSTMPYGVHGSGASLPSTSQPRFVGCSPSASLTGSTSPRMSFSFMCLGSGSWTM